MIALPVLNRVVAIPFSVDGSRVKVAITDPQDVRGLDELRLATRLTVEFYVAAKNDVLAELRRLLRAAEAGSTTIVEEITAGRMPTRALGPREASLIMTGAPLPPGADAHEPRRTGLEIAQEDLRLTVGASGRQIGRVARYRPLGAEHSRHRRSCR